MIGNNKSDHLINMSDINEVHKANMDLILSPSEEISSDDQGEKIDSDERRERPGNVGLHRPGHIFLRIPLKNC
jgi:hypothetical protein